MCEAPLKKIKKPKLSEDFSDFYNSDGKTQLHLAAEQSNHEVAEVLLRTGLDVNCVTTANNHSALHIAAKLKDKKMCQLLLEFGAKTELYDLDGKTPLLLSVEGACLEVAELLLQNNADVGKTTAYETSVLHISAQLKNKEMCVLLLNFNARIDIYNAEGKTPLLLAVEGNSYDVVKVLLQNNANVNRTTPQNVSALHIAAKSKNKEICQLLLKYRARTEICTPDGKTPLLLAVEGDCYEVAEILLQNKADVSKTTAENLSLLHIAAKLSNREMCKLLLKFKAETEVYDPDGKTALLLAVEKASYKVAEVLLQYKADVNRRIGKNMSALDTAVKLKNKNMCQLLLKFRARTEMYNLDGKTPLLVSVEDGSYEVAEVLLQNRADVNAAAGNNITALREAAMRGNAKMCRLLLTYGADPNLSDVATKRTPLLVAIKKYPRYEVSERTRVQIVKMLLYKKADVDHEDLNRNTALHIASGEDYADVCEVLLDHKANPNIRSIRDVTPIHIATGNKNYKIVQLLLQFKADVNAVFQAEGSHCSSIFLAMQLKKVNLFTLFIKYDAKLDITMSVNGHNMFIVAVKSGKVLFVKTMIERCEVCPESYDGLLKTAVIRSKRFTEGAQIVECLISHGFKVNKEDFKDGAFMEAVVEKGYLKLFEEALAHGFDVNLPLNNDHDFCSCSFLHAAAKNKRTKIAELLLIQGAEVDVVDCDGTSALIYAIEGASPVTVNFYCSGWNEVVCDSSQYETTRLDLEMVELLLEWGSNVHCKNKEGLKPLALALKSKNFFMLKLLLRHNAIGNSEGNNKEENWKVSDVKCREIFKLLLDNTTDLTIKNTNSLNHHGFIKIENNLYHVSEILLQDYAIKLKAADLLINKNLPESVLNEDEDFREHCELQVSAMKMKSFSGSSVSFYDVLTISIRELVFILGDNILSILRSRSWKKKYPLYTGMIQYKLLLVERRRKLMCEFSALFCKFVYFPQLPEVCVSKIVGFFTKSELKRLVCLSKLNRQHPPSSEYSPKILKEYECLEFLFT